MNKTKIALNETLTEELSQSITSLLFAEKETVIDALQNDYEQALTDEIYYALRI